MSNTIERKDLDFIGFTFNGFKSSDLGILRVSDGSRYNHDLLPTIANHSSAIEGRDGSYYWGSDYTQKTFNLNIAFDHLTEEQYHKLSAVFGTKDIVPLVFNETPYKKYMVKSTGTNQIKTICFMENNQRIYKGEGTLSFIAFYPYAIGTMKFLTSDEQDKEWVPGSGLIYPGEAVYNRPDGTPNLVNLYNGGQLETYCTFEITLQSEDSSTNSSDPTPPPDFRDVTINLSYTKGKVDEEKTLIVRIPQEIFTNNKKIKIDFKNQLFIVYNNEGKIDMNIESYPIAIGEFFSIPTGHSTLQVLGDAIISTNGANDAVFYDYIYY